MAGLRDIGEFIREQRRNAQISLRQLADQAGVSNPYLSQIERGLRKPSAEVLQQIATALRVSTPVMYLRAGLLDAGESQGVLAAIAADSVLTNRQKQTLAEIYEAFRRENVRTDPVPEPAGPVEPTPEPPAAPSGTKKPGTATKPHAATKLAARRAGSAAKSAGTAQKSGRRTAPKPPAMATEPPAAPDSDLS